MTELEQVVSGFKDYDRIVVTGPQRSGTQIATKMIADILGWKAVTESSWNLEFNDNDQLFYQWENTAKQEVLQCPRISHACHNSSLSTLVVFMMRHPGEILSSDLARTRKFTKPSPKKMKMVSVQSVFLEKKEQYSRLFFNGDPITVEETPDRIYEAWHTIQKADTFNWYELEYNRLQQHHLWLPLDIRRSLFVNGTQTTV